MIVCLILFLTGVDWLISINKSERERNQLISKICQAVTKKIQTFSNITAHQAQMIRDAARPTIIQLKDVSNIIAATVRQPSVTVMHICDQSKIDVTGTVTGVTVINVNDGESMISWSDRKLYSRCIITFEIYFYNTSKPVLINNKPLSSNVFFHMHSLQQTYPHDYVIKPIYFGLS